ncbi:MAG: sugar phosphate nucleotidyltransferase [Candidatus Omnitrophota bacterium]|nr:sugar phosphate nucleotidyltransferase [Candidatus Omnitrophota bacterium]
MNYAIILAGGVGSRFWPLSRSSAPKQFLRVCSDRTMLAEAIQRVSGPVKKEHIYVAASYRHNRQIKKCLRGLRVPAGNIFLEPSGKNTFGPIAALTARISCLDPQAVIMAIPSDHFVRDIPGFKKLLDSGIQAAKDGHIVTLGARPVRPETGYGYIKTGSRVKGQGSRVYRVEKFIEKPGLKLARKLCRGKNWFWNAGNFIFQARTMLGEIKKFMPLTYELISKIKSNKDILNAWVNLPDISVDYAIMEKTKKLALLPCGCGWSDLGSWKSMEEIHKKDKAGNIFKCGKHLDIGSRDTIIFSGKRFIATIGLDNLIVVDSGDALLICAKDKSQEVKKLVQALKEKGFRGLL